MAKLYESKKTHMTVASGEVVGITPDRLGVTIKTQKYDSAEKKSIATEITFKSAVPFAEDIEVGKNATVCGFFAVNPMDPSAEGYQAVYASSTNSSFEHGVLAVINGEVVFAEYREEKNEDGSPKMTLERVVSSDDGEQKVIPPKPRKPHFDIGISTEELDSETGKTRRVLHTIKEYPYNGDMTKVERYKKLFANFNKETNPVYATIVTAPAEIKPREHEYNGKVYTNYYANHMGTNMVDVVFEKALMKETETSKDEEAPAPEVSLPQGVTLPDTPTVGTQPVSREEINGLEEDPIPEILDDDGLFAE